MNVVQTSTTILLMHQKLTKHGMSCMQINQHPNKTPVESTDNSNDTRNWSLVRAATDAFLKDLSSNRKKHMHKLFRLMGTQCSRNKSIPGQPQHLGQSPVSFSMWEVILLDLRVCGPLFKRHLYLVIFTLMGVGCHTSISWRSIRLTQEIGE